MLIISSEHQELFGLCDRVLVMGEGELRGELTPPDYSEENLCPWRSREADSNGEWNVT